MEAKTLKELTQAVSVAVQQKGYTDHTVNRYESILLKLQQFYIERGETFYNPTYNRDFLCVYKEKLEAGLIAARSYRRYQRAVALLEGYYNSGDIKTTYSYGTRYRWELSLYYQSHVNGYVSSLSNMVLGTKRVCESIARDFFHYLETQGIKSLEAINQEHIINYIVENGAAHMYSMSSFTLALRRLNKYLKKVAAINIPDEIIPFKGKRGRRRVYPSFSNEEMVEILKKTDPNSIEGKRDYAILLLAAYTGLRAIDIARLRLTDINWIDKAVNIIQHKTGVPNCLPLDDIVRAAIADYILNGRPATDSDHVFITTTAPYRKLNDCTSVSNIVEKYMKRAGIQHEPWDGKGFHAIRRRMGVSLLEASVPIEMIAQVLGHTDMDSIKHYLPINIDKLRICALGFEDIPITGGIYL